MYSNQAKQTLDLRSLALWARYLLLAKPFRLYRRYKEIRPSSYGGSTPTGIVQVGGIVQLVCEPVGALFNASPEQRMEPFNPCALRGNQRARNPGVVSAYRLSLRGNPRSFSLICLPRSRGCKLDIKRPQPNFSTQAPMIRTAIV